MQPPHGPFKIGANRQITLPAELLGRLQLDAGDSVYVAQADDDSGTLLVIPVEKLVAWLDAGRNSDTSSTSAKRRAERPAE